MAKANRNVVQLPLPLDGQTTEILLTKDHIVIIDSIDGDLCTYLWTANEIGSRIYASRKPGAQNIYLHRVILERILGRRLKENEMCDHKNGYTLDCTRSNLRLATHQQNMWNRAISSRNKSGVLGVHWNRFKQKWRARIRVNGKVKELGDFKRLESAERARLRAEIKYYGEFAPSLSRPKKDD